MHDKLLNIFQRRIACLYAWNSVNLPNQTNKAFLVIIIFIELYEKL